tara:strand:- start:311 stop:1630 length:1320 start_codon:yes stop_codon:yes gene_type:complete
MSNEITESRRNTEQAVIGCLLMSNKAIDAFTEIGGTRDWFEGKETIVAASEILERYAKGGMGVDFLMIGNATGLPVQWLESCIDLVPSAAYAENYIGMLRDHAALDSVRAMTRQANQLALSASPEGVGEVKASIEALISTAISGADGSGMSLSEAAGNWLDKMTAEEGDSTLLDWPCRVITDAIGRITKEVIWVIAQPSVGKTAFVVQWLTEIAARGKVASLASLESDIESIASRCVSHQAPMNTENIRQRRATEKEIEQAREAGRMISSNIRVTDRSMTLDQLYAWGKSEARKGAAILFVDNTRHIQVPGRDSRSDKMAAISSRMCMLRRDTGLPVVVLHHSKVDQDGREGISWSADIEKDADMVIFLKEVEDKCVAPCPENKQGRWCIAFDVDKNREGRKKVRVSLEFEKEHQRFIRWVDNPYNDNENVGEEKLWNE